MACVSVPGPRHPDTCTFARASPEVRVACAIPEERHVGSVGIPRGTPRHRLAVARGASSDCGVHRAVRSAVQVNLTLRVTYIHKELLSGSRSRGIR